MTIKPKAKLTIEQKKLRAIKRSTGVAKNNYARFGLFGQDSSPEGLTVAEVGVLNEFGTRNIPARPFLIPSAKQNQPKYFKYLQKLLADMMLNPTKSGQDSFIKGLAQLALVAAADVKNFITRGAPLPPPNAPSVVARKQKLAISNSQNEADGERRASLIRTLVDTGRMVQAITGSVFRRGKK